MKTQDVVKASAVMALGTGLARLLGFVRGVILIAAIGSTTPAGNIFDVANRLPTVLYLLVAGGVLNAIIVPQIIRAGKHDDGGTEYLNKLVTLAGVCLLGATGLLTLAAPYLVRLYADHSWSEAAFTLAIAFAYWCIPQVFFLGMYAVLGQILNARKSFGPYMWAPVLNNICGIAALIVFIQVFGAKNTNDNQHATTAWTTDMIVLLAGSTTATMALQVIILLPFLRQVGFRYRPVWNFWTIHVDSASRVALWTLGAVVAAQAAFIVTSKVCAKASAYAESLQATPEVADSVASNATYTYAFLVTLLPHSLVVVSVVTALVTRMSHNLADSHAANKTPAPNTTPVPNSTQAPDTTQAPKTTQANSDDASETGIESPSLSSDMTAGLRSIAILTVLATAGLIALSDPIGLVMTNEPRSAHALAIVVVCMALGLVPFSLNYLLQRVCYTLENGSLPFWAQVPNLVVMTVGNVIAYFWASPEYLVPVAALSMSVGNVVGAIVLTYYLARMVPEKWQRDVGKLLLKVVPVGIILSVAGWWLSHIVLAVLPGTRLIGLAISAILGATIVAAYIVVLRTLRVPEVHTVSTMLRQQRQISTNIVPGER